MSSEMRELVRKWKFNLRLLGPDVARRVLESCISDVEALLARTEAGAKCDHAWQPDSDVMNARYCPKCDVTQTIPKKTTRPQDASGDAVKPLMAARETEDDGAAIMGRLARALAKADPSSKLPRRAIDWLRSKGIHWKSHCPTDPLHNFDEPLTGAGDNDDLPAFLEWVAGEVVRRDTRAGNFAEGLAQSLRGRAHILRIVKNDAMQAKEAK